MKVKFYLFGILILFGVGLETHAQVSFLKKSMGNLGSTPKVGDLQNNASLDNVDMTTGTLKIGIPLYEIKVNDISVPISLSYSALGLKVGQEAGPVGMGWELNAGGKILTNVNGLPDGSPQGIPGNNMPNVSNLQPFTSLTDYELVKDILDGTRDPAWDTYNYILPNGGGSYVANGLTFPYDPLITIDHSARTIKTTDGLVYKFTVGDSKLIVKIKKYDTTTNPPTYNNIDWRDETAYNDFDLDSIISTKYKSFVKFVYKSFYYEDEASNDRVHLTAKTRTTTSETLPLYRDVEAAANASANIVDYSPYDQVYQICEPINTISETQYRKHSRITDIVFPNGKVVFEYDPTDILGRDVLNNIFIYKDVDGTPVLLKKYHFIYDNNTTYGHYLSYIQVYDASNTLQDYWAFTYVNDWMPVIPNVPNFAQDRWGFFNNQTGNKTLLENPNNTISLKTRRHYPILNDDYNTSTIQLRYNRAENKMSYGFNLYTTKPDGSPYYYYVDFANRGFSFANAQKGTLQSVHTPTGATYYYEYEPHRIRYNHFPGITPSFNIITEDGGGIRVKSITRKLDHQDMYYNIPAAERSFKKIYEYGQALYSNSGVASETDGVGIVSVPGNAIGNINLYGKGSGFVSINNIMLLSHPVNNMVQYGGSYAMYTAVTEKLMKSDTGPDTYGKTVYYSHANTIPPDYKWRENGFSLDNPNLPVTERNLGVKLETVTGIYGVKKYSYIDGAYSPVEENLSTFQTFSAPQNTQNKLVSFYGGITGQLSGEYPASPFNTPNIFDAALLGSRAGFLITKFNALQQSASNVGMDYITRSLMAPEGNTINYNGKYYTELVDLNQYSNCVRKIKEEKTVFSNGYAVVDHLGTTYTYANPAHLQPTKIATKSSRGDSTFTRIKYAQDYPYPDGMLSYMKNSKLGLNEPIEQFTTHNAGTSDNTEYLKSSTLNTFTTINGAIYSREAYTRKLDQLLTTYNNGYGYTGNSIDTNLFKLQVSYNQYQRGNLHMYKETDAPGNVVIWGYNNQFPIAKVVSADNPYGAYSTDVCYTSFESADFGNWTYAGIPVNDATSISGRKVYNLASGNITKTYTKSGGRFIISYWYKQGSVVNVTGTTVGAEAIKNRRGNWILAEREVSTSDGYVTVSGTGYIDELRYHPYDAQMTTYTYDPLVGVTGSFDAKGNASYYEYDDSQRLRNIKDQHGNIVKSYRYNIGILN